MEILSNPIACVVMSIITMILIGYIYCAAIVAFVKDKSMKLNEFVIWTILSLTIYFIFITYVIKTMEGIINA